MALPASDTFLQTSGGPQALNVYSANWQQVQGTFTVPNATGDVRCVSSGVDHLARWTADTPGASQYAEVTPATGWAASGRYIGPAVRVSASGDAYSVQATGADWVVGRMVGGAWTGIGSGSWTAADGQAIRIEVETIDAATVRLVLKRNGTTVTTIDDTNAARITAANSLGFGGYDAAGSDPGIADWSGGNLGAAATVDQEGARLGADDSSESAHTWLAAQDANATVAVGTAFLVRMLLNGTGDAASASHVLRYQKNGTGGFVPVPVGSGNAEVLAQPTWGAVGTAGSGTTSCTPAYPTGITAATSKLFCAVTGRSNTANTVPTMPAGWTRIGGLEDGTGTWAVDTGPRRVDFFQKDVTDGTETGTVTVSLSGTTANTLRASIFRIEVPSGYLVDVALGTGADTSNDTSYSAASSTSLELDANRLLVLATAQNLDTGTATSRAVSASGITLGTLTNRADTAVTNGNDHRHIINSVPVSSGSGTVAPTFSYTVSAAASGPTAFLVLRARLAAVTNEIYVAPSANIAAGGEATTARLTAPSGKTTADFVAGRRWDDENGTDAIDLTTDDYTELEWSINTQAPAANGDAFEFRVYAGAAALDTYTVTPQITLGAAATPSPPIRTPAARLAPLLHF